MKNFYPLLGLLAALCLPTSLLAHMDPGDTAHLSHRPIIHSQSIAPAPGARTAPDVGPASAQGAASAADVPGTGPKATPPSARLKTPSSKARARREVIGFRHPDAPVLRIYEDDDFFNIRGKGTDEGYTNGSRLDYFYYKHHRDRFADRWLMPNAGPFSRNTYGWGAMEVMFTPTNIKVSQYLPSNYPYSGAFFLTHTKYSYDPIKRYSFQTELIGGLMGPATQAGPMQSWLHGVIHYQRPKGWSNQLPNDMLLNENLTAEKEIAHIGRGLEWLAGASGYLGTMLDGGAVYSTVRVGWMNPYFDGWSAQYGGRGRRHMQLYFFGTPRAEWTAYNALLEGGLLSRKIDTWDKKAFDNFGDRVKKGVAEIDYGMVFVLGGFTAAYTQKTASATLKGMGMHEVGNISFFITLR